MARGHSKNDPIRKAIIKAADRMGVTRNNLAAKLKGKISRMSVYGYLDGSRQIHVSSALLMARTLHVKIAVTVPGENQSAPITTNTMETDDENDTWGL